MELEPLLLKSSVYLVIFRQVSFKGKGSSGMKAFSFQDHTEMDKESKENSHNKVNSIQVSSKMVYITAKAP